MKYKQLGRTGLYVSEICLGTMTFGGGGRAISGAPSAQCHSARWTPYEIERALAAGVNFIDPADVYSRGQSERSLGAALKTLGVARKDVVIATKVFGPTGTGPNDGGASRSHIMDADPGRSSSGCRRATSTSTRSTPATW